MWLGETTDGSGLFVLGRRLWKDENCFYEAAQRWVRLMFMTRHELMGLVFSFLCVCFCVCLFTCTTYCSFH